MEDRRKLGDDMVPAKQQRPKMMEASERQALPIEYLCAPVDLNGMGASSWVGGLSPEVWSTCRANTLSALGMDTWADWTELSESAANGRQAVGHRCRACGIACWLPRAPGRPTPATAQLRVYEAMGGHSSKDYLTGMSTLVPAMREITRDDRSRITSAILKEDFGNTLPASVAGAVARQSSNRDYIWAISLVVWARCCSLLVGAHELAADGSLRCGFTAALGMQMQKVRNVQFAKLKHYCNDVRGDLGYSSDNPQSVYDLVLLVLGANFTNKKFAETSCPLCSEEQKASWRCELVRSVTPLIAQAREYGRYHLVGGLTCEWSVHPRASRWLGAAAYETAGVNKTRRLDVFDLLLTNATKDALGSSDEERLLHAVGRLTPTVIPVRCAEAFARIAGKLDANALNQWLRSSAVTSICGSEEHSTLAISVAFFIGVRAIEQWFASASIEGRLNIRAAASLIEVVVSTILSEAQTHWAYRQVAGQ